MQTTSQSNLCKAYLYSSLTGKRLLKHHGRRDGPVVTISRQAGARGNSLAVALVAELGSSETIPQHRPWTVFNHNLLDHCIDEHSLPELTAEYFPEDKPEEIRSLIGELLGLHPGVRASARKMAETIRSLGGAGNAIIVGRGANLINGDIVHALHVRLVGDLKSRVRHFASLRSLTIEEAENQVRRLDRGRKRYLKANFGYDIDDARQYDIIINTDRFSNAKAARIIRHALEAKYR